MRKMNIAQNLEQSRLLFPDKPALIFEEQSVTYRELDELSNRVANGLTALGIQRGERVALLLPNIPAFLFSYFGLQKIGVVVVAINSALKAAEIECILQDSNAVAVITTAALRAQVCSKALPALKHLLIAEDTVQTKDAPQNESSLADLMARSSTDAQSMALGADDPALIAYSSGTTGLPKGITLSHGNVLSNSIACTTRLALHAADRVLLCLPLFHNFGQNSAMSPCLVAGATLVLHREFNLEIVLQSVVKNAVTVFFGVPTLYLLLQEKASAEQLQSVRLYVSAAATLPIELQHKWQAKFGVAIREGYGLTETLLNTLNPVQQSRLGSVGQALTDIQLQIVNHKRQVVAAGELGEVCVRGPNVMLGYWNRPEATAQVLQDGWLYSGDIGYADADGYFYIVDRVKDMINIGGQKVYPSEVEAVFYRHPAVQEIAVYGIAEATLGEQVCASVVLADGQRVASADLIGFCRSYLADFKLPSRLEFVDQLPKGRSGKILKRILREQMQASSIAVPPLSLDGALHGDAVSAIHALDLADSPLLAYVQQALANLLAIEPSQLDRQHPLVGLGLNSLTAVALHNRLQRRFGVDVPIVKLLDDFTLERLVTWIVEQGSTLTADASLPPVDPPVAISHLVQATVQEQPSPSQAQKKKRVQVAL